MEAVFDEDCCSWFFLDEEATDLIDFGEEVVTEADGVEGGTDAKDRREEFGVCVPEGVVGFEGDVEESEQAHGERLQSGQFAAVSARRSCSAA